MRELPFRWRLDHYPAVMSFDLNDLLACLRLREVGPNTFEGDNLDLDYRRVFGGQVLAQTVVALERIAGGKALKSFTQHFPREGDVTLPLTFEVTTHQAGRTFATVAASITQAGRLVSQSAASLHLPERGPARNDDPPAVGRPEDAYARDLSMVPWEVRVVGGTDLGTRQCQPARYQFWMRCATLRDAAADTPWMHQALLAHASDLTVIGTALLPIRGLSQDDSETAFHSAVTSHSMWFHQPFRLDEWVLVDQTSPVMAGGRAFGRGDVWSEDGRLVASFAQESLVRMVGD